jgi:hypothetical protein
MRNTRFNRTIGTFAAALMALAVSQPASAQSLRSQIDAEMNRIGYNNPGSVLVFAGCAAAATNEYRNTGSTERGLNVLVGCAAIGCAFTDSYKNCISVNTQMFLLSVARS